MFYAAISNEQERDKVKQLYEKYKYILFAQANKILQDKYLSEDTVHQAFIRIIKSLQKIDEINCPRTRSFLVIICENVARDIYKQRLYLNTSVVSIDEIEDGYIEGSNPLEIMISNERIESIKDFVKKMDPKYRDVLMLKQTYGCNNEEISHLLNLPVETVKKRLYRARKQLKESIRKDGLTQHEKVGYHG